MDALIILALLVALAFAAQRWGWDSTDGVDSSEWDRRASWRAGRIGRARSALAISRRRQSVTRLRPPAVPRTVSPVYNLAVEQPRPQRRSSRTPAEDLGAVAPV